MKDPTHAILRPPIVSRRDAAPVAAAAERELRPPGWAAMLDAAAEKRRDARRRPLQWTRKNAIRLPWPPAQASGPKAGDQLLWTLMNWIPEGVAVIGGPPAFPIKMVSRFAREALQREDGEIVGLSTAAHQGALRIFLADGKTVPKSEQMPSYRATRFGEEVHNCEMVMYARNGRRFDLLVDAVPIRDAADNVVGAVVCCRDITALNRVKHAVTRAMAGLERRVQARTGELHAANKRLRCEIDRRQLLENRLVALLENEQRRIGQDLHDNIGSQLSGIELLCEALLRQRARPAAGGGVRTIARLLRGAMEDTRRIAHSMAPVPSCPQGLALSLRALARCTRMTTGCRCTVRSHGAPIDDPGVTLHLYRIAQEAIANAARHGAARRIAITLVTNRAGFRLTIRDDGRGMADNAPEHPGLGITTMKIRARAIGGTLAVGRNPAGGTDVICTVSRPPPPPPSA